MPVPIGSLAQFGSISVSAVLLLTGMVLGAWIWGMWGFGFGCLDLAYGAWNLGVCDLRCVLLVIVWCVMCNLKQYATPVRVLLSLLRLY